MSLITWRIYVVEFLFFDHVIPPGCVHTNSMISLLSGRLDLSPPCIVARGILYVVVV